MAQQYDLPRKATGVQQPPARVTPAQPAVPVPVVPAAKLSRQDPRGLEGFIRETAAKYGVDPEVALRVAKSEGLRDFYGDGGKSGGAFQLYTGGGLGNDFQKATGLDPLDPANEKATIEYALQQASQGGWGPWHGAQKIGVGQFEGIRNFANVTDPTPNVGSGASDYAATDTANTTTPEDKKDKKDSSNKYGEAFGEGLENIGKVYAAGTKTAAPSPTTVPTPVLPMPQGPASMVDAKRADMQRQQLALAMQRLNTGRLV